MRRALLSLGILLAGGPASAQCDADGICEPRENACTCPMDCPGVCGDGCCGPGESMPGCPADCQATCNDGTCGVGENCANCADCQCTTGTCNGETCCGDATCESSEEVCSCAADCS
ncbi:MAG: hypothetical protein ACREE7_18285, partial [Dongiaceae bacterium]